jgi:hypothetical protein
MSAGATTKTILAAENVVPACWTWRPLAESPPELPRLTK